MVVQLNLLLAISAFSCIIIDLVSLASLVSSSMDRRKSNNPKRRIVPHGSLTEEEKKILIVSLRYVGSALHKRRPGNYGFHPPVNPRPHKSMCDDKRSIILEEAQSLFEAGIKKGMVSIYRENNVAKYVWSVDADGEVYEAKIGNEGFHGYRLSEENESIMRNVVLDEWEKR